MAKKKRKGNRQLRVRMAWPIWLKVRAVAKVYDAPVTDFVRDMLVAICSDDMSQLQPFLVRLQKGMLEYRQRELTFDDGHFTAPQQGVKVGRSSNRGRLTKGTV